MKHKFVLVSASVFAMSGLVTVAHATSLGYLCGQTIIYDTEVTDDGGSDVFDVDNCSIEVDNARLKVVGVTSAIVGELLIEDVTEDGGAAELVITNAKITTGGRLKIEGAWDGGVTFENNHVDTGDDLRVKAIGSGDLIFTNNRGQVGDDIRLGEVIKAEDDGETIVDGLAGDMDIRNNRITLLGQEDPDPEEPGTEFVAQSFDGGIDVRNNKLGGNVAKIDITSSGSGDIGVKNNEFLNTETAQEIKIISEDGDVRVLINTFGQIVDPVSIDSTNGQCGSSDRNSPDIETCEEPLAAVQ